MGGATPGLHLLDVAEAKVVVSAGVIAIADPDHHKRESEASSALIEDLGALVPAEAPSQTGHHRHRHHHHHPERGSTAQLLKREAHKREVAHPQGTVSVPMDQNIVKVPRQGAGAGAPWMMMLQERALGMGAPLKKMDAVVALALSLEMIEAPLTMMMITMVLRGAANLLKSG